MSNSSVISYNLELLDGYSSDMALISSVLIQVQDTINNFSSNIDSFWIGEAKQNFVNNKNKSIKDIETLSNQIKTNSDKLSEAIAIYREKNGIIADKISVLSTDNIF